MGEEEIKKIVEGESRPSQDTVEKSNKGEQERTRTDNFPVGTDPSGEKHTIGTLPKTPEDS